MGSGSSEGRYCPEHGFMTCPLCGSVVDEIEYRGKEPDLLALMKRADFRCFVGCVRVELHDKVVDGVNYRGKVFVRPLFWKRSERSELSNGLNDLMIEKLYILN